VLTVRSVPGRALGMVTLGALPNAPVAVTAVFAPAPLTLPPEADADADADAEEDEDDEELDFDEPQPARATQASRGMAMSARKRRMKNLESGGCQPSQPTGRAERPCPGTGRPGANSQVPCDLFRGETPGPPFTFP